METTGGMTRSFCKVNWEKVNFKMELGLFGSDDGSLKLLNLKERYSLATFPLKNQINSVLFIEPLNLVLVGFESGIMKSFSLKVDTSKFVNSNQNLFKLYSMQSKEIRDEEGFIDIIEHNNHKLKMNQMFNVFSCGIKTMIVSPCQNHLAIQSINNEVFVMILRNSTSSKNIIRPLFLVKISEEMTDLKFQNNQQRLMFGSSNGKIVSFKLPEEREIDNRKNYLMELNDPRLEIKYIQISMMEFQKPKLDENDLFYVLNGSSGQENIEWDPEKINSLLEVPLGSGFQVLSEQLQEELQQIEESEMVQEEIKNSKKQNESKESNEPKLVEKKMVDTVKIGKNVIVSESLEGSLILATSEGNYLGYLYILQLLEFQETTFIMSKGNILLSSLSRDEQYLYNTYT